MMLFWEGIEKRHDFSEGGVKSSTRRCFWGRKKRDLGLVRGTKSRARLFCGGIEKHDVK